MSFPLAYHFIQGAFDEQRDFYKSAARSNPLVDDVFQTHQDLSKRQRLKLKATALLDPIEIDFSKVKELQSEEYDEETVAREVRNDIEIFKECTKRKSNYLNSISY